MSEVIVRMEMPLNCAVCRCHTDGWCYLLSIQPSECTYDSRPSWCPIVGELPEQHGDLIDRDVSIQTLKCVEEAPYSGFDGQEPFYAPEDVVNTLLCQDVVIAAERSET